MTPYEPRHENLFRDRPFDFMGGGAAGGGLFFFSSRFSSDRKTEIFFSLSESQNIFFRTKQKHFFFFFSKQHICSKCILLDLYVRVLLEPNIHEYIVYMFVYTCILDIWVPVYMSRDMTKPTKWLCAQRRLRSAWASAQSDQALGP